MANLQNGAVLYKVVRGYKLSKCLAVDRIMTVQKLSDRAVDVTIHVNA